MYVYKYIYIYMYINIYKYIQFSLHSLTEDTLNILNQKCCFVSKLLIFQLSTLYLLFKMTLYVLL